MRLRAREGRMSVFERVAEWFSDRWEGIKEAVSDLRYDLTHLDPLDKRELLGWIGIILSILALVLKRLGL